MSERLAREAQAVQLRRAQLTAAVEAEEQQQTTFKPQISEGQCACYISQMQRFKRMHLALHA